MQKIFYAAGLLLLLAACKQEEKPLTREEALTLAKKMEISIGKRDGKLLDELIDEKALLQKMDADPQAFGNGLVRGMKLGTNIVNSLTKKGSYSFIKAYEKDKAQHILFRLYDSKINYHDYELKRSRGEPRIADAYIYMTGENLSETLKSLYGQMKDEFGKSEYSTITWTRQMPKIRELINEDKHREALDLYNKIPPSVQKAKLFQIVHVEICSGLSDEEHTKAIGEYETLYPNEPNMQLLLIDGYILRKEYTKALTAVNTLDKMIDKDPLLDFYRAMCYTLMKDDNKRIEHLERLVKNLPDFEDGILELLVDYLDRNEFEKARPLIERYKLTSSFDQERLTSLLELYPAYKEKPGK